MVVNHFCTNRLLSTHVKMPDMNVKQLISHRMSVLGISKAEAARRAGQNSPSFINNVLLDRVENITHKNMQRIAKALDLDPMYLAKPDLYAQYYDVDFSDLVDPVIDRNQEAIAADNTGAQQRFQATGTGTDIETRRRMMGAKPQTMSPAAVAARVATRDAEAPAFPAKSLPVFASAQGGDDGSVIIGNEPIDWITRPEPLLTVADAYAVYITGDSMAPAFDHGDTALVHPHLPVGRGDDVIFQTDNRPGEDRKALIKRLVTTSQQIWTVEQFNPRREFTLTRSSWPKAHFIVGKFAR